MSNRHRVRGFSIVELLMALTITALMLGVVAANLRGSARRADSRGAAELLASSLRQARQQALSEGRSIAIAFPSANGTLRHASGYYRLEGETRPQVRSLVDFRREYGGVGIFCGRYNGLAWSDKLAAGVAADNFRIEDWNAPYPADFMLVFLANGAIVSNLERGDGSYRLVVAKSFQYSGDRLQSAYEAVTVSLSPDGEIRLDPRVLGGSVAGTAADSPEGAPVPAISVPGANTDPEMVAPFLRVDPRQNPKAINRLTPAGSTATVPQDGHLTFTVFARDGDGDQLWCHWTGPGSFSSDHGTRMVWDEEHKLWSSQWTWRVPSGTKVDKQYVLSCKVYDNRGGVTSPTEVGLQPTQPAIITRQCLLCAMRDGIYRWNWDGTDAVKLVGSEQVEDKPITYARFSPDFSHIAFGAGSDVYLVGAEGKGLRRLYRYNNPVDGLCWAADGLTLYTLSGSGIRSLQPSAATAVSQDVMLDLELDRPSGLTLHPGGAPFLTSDHSSGDFLVVWPADGSRPAQKARISGGSGDESHSPIFNSAGNQLFFRCREPGTSGLCYERVNCTVDVSARTITLSDHRKLLDSLGSGARPTVSPDGLFIAGGMKLEPGTVSICSSNGGSQDSVIDVTPVSLNEDREVVDVDWGYY